MIITFCFYKVAYYPEPAPRGEDHSPALPTVGISKAASVYTILPLPVRKNGAPGEHNGSKRDESGKPASVKEKLTPDNNEGGKEQMSSTQ